MAAVPPAERGQWSSRFGFLMAAIGSSVGLGNFWRFPYMAGENGGAVFMIVYLACVFLVAFPILIAEYAVGRHAKMSAVGSVAKMAQDAGAPSWWQIAGWVGMAGGFLLLCFYSVVAGWVSAYAVKLFSGEFVAMPAGDVQAAFAAFTADTQAVLFWHTAFMVVSIWIVSRGISGGIERATSVLMPIFFLMLLGMVVFGFVNGDPYAAFAYLFAPDFSELNAQMVLAALGQAFFSIGVGSAIMITYGSYLKKTENIAGNAGIVTVSDTAIAIIAGLAIFPIVFGVGLDPAAGPSLFFEALPAAFSLMGDVGRWAGGAFFTLAIIAALTSSISLLQVVASWAEEYTKLSRGMIVWLFGGIIWLVGVGVVYSGDFMGFLDQAVEILLPLGGLLIALFTGWVVSKKLMREELPNASDRMFNFWRFTIRFVAPLAVAFVLVFGVSDILGLGLTEQVFGNNGG